ncbi:putative nucleotidyltransferase with HDIG domain [Silvimonas terrae]|uniref:Putative nucleotidyltransferase with HDIG domain n=1 Tax=Silvimonas terrae TaxID=300266 RepID=A0A840RKK0_9NEIS|nr:HD-GYP domain-containing protein [Silvimonas terrae]MBB5192826.1 putative nucleotidyltransferase with HDIG domain [Silvimonas terrae]
MIRKITIDQLTVGMYIHDLNLAWFDHPFVRNQFMLDSAEDLAQIRAIGLKELYIDSAKGRDVAEAPSLEEVQARTEATLLEALLKPDGAGHKPTSLRDEAHRAVSIHKQADRAVRKVMQDVRLGRMVEIAEVEDVVDAIAGTIERNPSAMLGILCIRNKNEYTFLHSVAVGTLMIAFAKSMGMDADTVRSAGVAGLLHDTGKMCVPDHILDKPGRLTEEEFNVIKSHPLEGWEVLRQLDGIDPIALEVTLHHHERLDGTGYPHKLKGDQISQITRMASIVDVYDAITSDRVYHKGLPAAQVLRKLWEWSPDHFDPQLVQHFIRTVGIYPVGSVVRLESGRLAVVIEANAKAPLLPRLKVVFSLRSNSYIPPEEFDMARQAQRGADRIVGVESAERYGIDISRYLLTH